LRVNGDAISNMGSDSEQKDFTRGEAAIIHSRTSTYLLMSTL